MANEKQEAAINRGGMKAAYCALTLMELDPDLLSGGGTKRDNLVLVPKRPIIR
jgi:hypothetical protein